MQGQVLFFIGNLITFIATLAFANLLMRDREPWRRALLAVSAAPILVVVSLQALGIVHYLNEQSAIVAMALITAVATSVCWWRNHAIQVMPLSRPVTPLFTFENRIASYAAAGLLAAVWGCFAASSLGGTTLFLTDDLIYHGPAVAHWIQDGYLSLSVHRFSAYYPMNAELFTLWLVLPFHADGLVNMAGFYWMGLATISIVFLSRLAGGGTPAALAAGAMFISAPIVSGEAQTYTGASVAGPAAMLAAIALAIPSDRIISTMWSRSVDALCAGLMTGIAVGIKVTFAPVAVVLACLFAVGWGGNRRAAGRMTHVSIFIVGCAVTGGYWYVRNMLLTGNPIFPAEVGPFSGPFTKTDQFRTSMSYWILSAGTDLKQWIEIARTYLGWGFGLGILAVCGYILAFIRLFRMQDNLWREKGTRILLLIIGLVLLFLHPLMPFSGTADSPNAEFLPMQRYLIAYFGIGLVLFVSTMHDFSIGRKLLLPVVILAIAQNWIRYFPGNIDSIVLHGVLAALTVVGLFLVQKTGKPVRMRHLAVGVIITIIGAMAIVAPYKQEQMDANLYRLSTGDHALIGQAWKPLRLIPDGKRVAAFGPDMWMYYPLFGRQFQLVPCPGDDNLTAYIQYHLRNPPATSWWWHEAKEEFDSKKMLHNIRQRDVQYVMTTKGENTTWPPQHTALTRYPAAVLEYNDGQTALWKLLH